MSEPQPFSVDIGKLRTATKPEPTAQFVKTSDVAGEKLGFVNRAPKGRGGRQPSPRTGQVHAKTLPHVSDEISAEAKRRGVVQGVLIEEAWALYCRQNGLETGEEGA